MIWLHAFGQRYDLPLSLALYLYAAGGVVVISFVMVAAFAGDRVGERALRYPSRPAGLLSALDRNPWTRRVTGAIGVLALSAVIVFGTFGSQSALRNPASFIVWIYMWAALVILAGLAGNLWSLLNPFRALHTVLSRLTAAPTRSLPERLGAWPAVLLFFLFTTFELASGLAAIPRVVAGMALAYTLMTLAGMLVFGVEAWLGRVEFLSLLFDLISRFGPVERTAGGIRLRPWGVGLLRPYPAGWDRIAFIVLTLSSLAFDGVIATPFWFQIAGLTAPLTDPLGSAGIPLLRMFGLLALTLVFLVAFTVIARLVVYLGSRKVEALPTMTAFALTLVPIALVYNAAHNYSYLTVQSQGILPLLSDPFGTGQQPAFVPSFALANAAVVWYVQVVLIVIGHVVAVYLAHLRAGERFRTARDALLSQYPMLVLMVAYTMTSLWILAQPTTRGG